ncbi:CPBP family intramembrane glutamic endopeptidase [Alkaliphilus sp. B6464]|uniref:CPBP family intramembrane glutamic endopeptidase n=1 Tax=Alkaliphilus sp. B6464 TaxID=2731219 RepID=UPI001BACA1A1|nr:CPBP family intramembrane glutamic endopeptidase [Alkaliphilus sp. B6464]QUH19960.1 CPBP family intramembrane metalloprotease [Alkaliphilus sp. B6464]
MKSINKRQFIILCTAPILCISMLLLIPLLTNKIGKTRGYIGGFWIYWLVFCLPVSLYSCNGLSGLKGVYSQRSNIKTSERIIWYLIAFMPCIATFFIVFKNFVPIAGFQVLVIALAYALINGTIEELFWRGIFNKVFNNNIFLAYIYPTIFFGTWHIALYFAKGMVYQGGFVSLVGGAFFMGLLWGWVAYKTKSIKIVTVAHIITNFFAFTGMIFENWFI